MFSAVVFKGIITCCNGFLIRFDVSEVSVIGYWNLRFICDLVHEIWDFSVLQNLLIRPLLLSRKIPGCDSYERICKL